MLAQDAESLCRTLFPNGKVEGGYFLVGDVNGKEGKSLRVCLTGSKAGLWSDFADSNKGGDLIDLIKATKGFDNKEAFCFAKSFLGIAEPPIRCSVRKTYKQPNAPCKLREPQGEMVAYFANRKISKETLARFKIGEMSSRKTGEPIIVFSYFDSKDQLSLIKYRAVRDKKKMFVSPNAKPCLYGWQAFDRGLDNVVLVEGEIDALSFGEQGICALSVPFGGGGGKKQDNWLDVEFEHLSHFNRIYLALDNDKQGQEATQIIAQRLGIERCYLVNFGKFKDANEVLAAGEKLQDYLDKAKEIRPVEIRNGGEDAHEILEYIISGEMFNGETLPWAEFGDSLKLRFNETYVWAGINGHGKSMFVGHIIIDNLTKGGKWLVASMEFEYRRLMTRFYIQALGRKPSNFEDELGFKRLFSGLYVYDKQGDVNGYDILEAFKYTYRRYGVNHLLIDSLMKCKIRDDDLDGQKNFISALTDFTRCNPVQIHLICHIKKIGSEEVEPVKDHIKGSGDITNGAENVIIVWRNKRKEKALEESEPGSKDYTSAYYDKDVIIRCVKQRNYMEGPPIGLYYKPIERVCGQYASRQNDSLVDYVSLNKVEGSDIYDTVPF